MLTTHVNEHETKTALKDIGDSYREPLTFTSIINGFTNTIF